MNHVVLLGARVLMALPFLIAGARKLLTWKATVAYFGKLGIPYPEVVLPLTLLVEVGGGIAIIANWRIRDVSVLMAFFCIGTALLAHRFWAVDPAQFNNQLNHFLKNVGLAGGFLMLTAAAMGAVTFKAKRA